jgi:hypothetical protein
MRHIGFCLPFLALVASLAPGIGLSIAHGRTTSELVLATSAEDPALTNRLVALGPGVSRTEAKKVTYISYTTGRELAQKWKMIASPTIQSFLINIGIKKGGYCYQFATELLIRLDAEKLKTLELHWGESDAGTDTEHNVPVITARGQPFEQGIILDNWRNSGKLLWGPITGDPSHNWRENAGELQRRLNRTGNPKSQASKPK